MATIKKENVIKAWEEGCSDVKSVLENLFPDIMFRPELNVSKGTKFMIEATVVNIDHDADTYYPYTLNLIGLKTRHGDIEEISLSIKSINTLIKNNA